MCSLIFCSKVHSSVNGRDFKRKMQAEHIELLQSPWLIELAAFYLNLNESDEDSYEISGQFSCDLRTNEPVMTLNLPDSMKLEYNLTCSICLVRSSFQFASFKKSMDASVCLFSYYHCLTGYSF